MNLVRYLLVVLLLLLSITTISSTSSATTTTSSSSSSSTSSSTTTTSIPITDERFFQAARVGDIKVLLEYIEIGGDINSRDAKGIINNSNYILLYSNHNNK
jgi:hypothetical protein